MLTTNKATLVLILLLMFPVYLGALPARCSDGNCFVVTSYYLWFPNAWSKNGYVAEPTLDPDDPDGAQCTGAVPPQHVHSNAAGSYDIAAVYYPYNRSSIPFANAPYRNRWGSTSAEHTAATATLNTHRGNIQNSSARGVILGYGRGGTTTTGDIDHAASLLSNDKVRVLFGIYCYSPRTKDTVQEDMETLALGTTPIVESGQRHLISFPTAVHPGTQFRPVFFINRPLKPENMDCEASCVPGSTCLSASYWADKFKATASFRQTKQFAVLGSELTSTEVDQGGFDGTTNYNPGVVRNATFYNDRANEAWGPTPYQPNYMYAAGVSPGYNPNRTKNGGCRARTQSRYRTELQYAKGAEPHLIVVNTFNEWNEGSQIEPATTDPLTGFSGVHIISGYSTEVNYEYLGYQGDTQNYRNLYLDITDNIIGVGTWDPRSGANVPYNVQ